ncbi:MAG: DUF1573 domain-containing protein [Bacteroides sp.]
MKRILSLTFFLLLVVLAIKAQPQLSFSQKAHDFGTIPWNKPVTAEFKVTNTGNSTLVISNVTTSCGCTLAEWTKQPIAPGEEGVISSTFDAKALGHFSKSIGIYSNASPKPIYLIITGEVAVGRLNYKKDYPFEIGNIRIDKNNIEFLDTNKGDKPTAEILVANTSNKAYEPILMHLPPYLKAVATPKKLARGRAGKIKITLDTRLLKNLGLTQTSVYLARFPGDKVGDENEITVSAVLLPDFSHLTELQKAAAPVIQLSETDIDMGPMGKKDKLSHTIIITNVGKSRLDIRELQVFNAAVNVSLRKRYINPGVSTKLKVTLIGKALKKLKSSPRVLMITNDPQHSKVIINLKATTK